MMASYLLEGGLIKLDMEYLGPHTYMRKAMVRITERYVDRAACSNTHA